MEENPKGKVEIMAPAGNFKSLAAAINAGADSVYFGVGTLNMRARGALNFNIKDLKKIAKICKENNVKTYLTVNIVFYDEELKEMRELIDSAKKAGIDAVIAHDMSVISYANKVGMPVHISTQANISNIEAVKYYSKFAGVVVLARELNLEQIKKIYDEIKKQNIKGPSGELVKIEAFVHGALCVSISGKCYMSLAKYNHSANRGDCFQVCRRGYKVTDEEDGSELEIDNKYVMSPKDLSTIAGVDRMIDAGIRVFKIEGRGRGEEYVNTVVKCYRDAINAVENDTYNEEKIKELQNKLNEVFNRGFWEGGYYMGEKTEGWSGELADAWAGAYGNQATKQKFSLGKAKHYYPKTGIGEFLIEAGDYKIKVGDEILISGKSTGVVECKVEEIYVHNGKDAKKVNEAEKGEIITVKVPSKINKSDELYLWADRKIRQGDAKNAEEEKGKNKEIDNLVVSYFYKFHLIENPEDFAEKLSEKCNEIGLKGRILVSREGINGGVSGSKNKIEEFKRHLNSIKGFSDIMFKDDKIKTHPFTRMQVLPREEIVAIKKEVDMSKTGKRMTPKELYELYKEGKIGDESKEVIMLDTRNDYEYKVGRFKDSIHLDIKTFKNFPEAIEKFEKVKNIKNKKIVMCCTGGIRCEKASAVLNEAGFKDVYQLDGGIINYGKEYPDTFWEGKLFVFDKRLVVPVNEKDNKPITKCEVKGGVCGGADCDLYRNCRNVNCDKLFICCLDCDKKLNGCCSRECYAEFLEQCDDKSRAKQGRKIKAKEMEMGVF